MLLHGYLEHVLGNKVSLTLLRIMLRYRGKVFTIRRLAEEAKVSPNETALTVHQLEKLGIVTIQPIGKAYHLELNSKSRILNKIITPVIDVEKNTLSDLVCLLKKHLDTKKIVSAAIFGSVVKGEEKMDSDIDLLVVANDHDHTMEKISEASEQVFSIFHGNISHIVFTEKQFNSKQKGSLIQSILDNHILICGKNLESIRWQDQ